jgi:pheromone shutdown-related protein TraB
MIDNANTHRLTFEDKEIILVGTAHVSRESADLVERVIREERPETVSVELCQSRYQSSTQKTQWQNTDLIKVIKERKASLLLSNLILASFQKRIGKKLGIKPGEEILRAIEAANGVDARLHLADRDIRITLSRLWRSMRLWTKVKLLFQVIASSGEVGELTEEDIEKMKKRDVLEMLLSELGQSLPEVRRVLIDERDQYLAHKIRTSPGGKTVAVVGAGHVPGIQRYWKEPIDIDELEEVPPKGKFLVFMKWGFPIGILGLIAFGFFMSGSGVAFHMIKWWILANGVLAGLGAAAALAHPLTILTAAAASPLTSLNPLIAAGWVAGLVEVFLGKPKVIDFENLTEDVYSVKGFWKNKITRILLVVVFTNMGSSFGTFVAIPLMLKVLA